MTKKIFIILLLSFSLINTAQAGINNAFEIGSGETEAGTGNTSKSALSTAAEEMGYDTDKNDINPVIEVIIRIALSFLGVIFMATLVYGGYLWMTSHGNDQQYEKSKNLIKAAIIGLFIIASAYAISWYVIDVMSQNTLTN